jgi:hypothetical protein
MADEKQGIVVKKQGRRQNEGFEKQKSGFGIRISS